MNTQPFLPRWIFFSLVTIIIIIFTFAVVASFFHIKTFINLNLLNPNLSKNPADWGVFGDFYNIVINSISTIIVAILSLVVFKAQQHRDDWERQYMAMQETPLLRFVAWE